MQTNPNIKYCQSCLERGISPPQQATREWQPGVYYCDDCFLPLLNNLTNIAPASISQVEIGKGIEAGPFLNRVYELLNVPKELQFDSVDITVRHYDKIFNFHAPSVVNRSLESLQNELEEMSIALFHIKFKSEPLDMYIKKLKEEKRKEKGLKDYDESKEDYATKGPKTKSTNKEKDKDKLLKGINAARAMMNQQPMTMAEYDEMQKKTREREFNIIAGNCPECGGSLPCLNHPTKS